jgi:hypothetical protein
MPAAAVAAKADAFGLGPILVVAKGSGHQMFLLSLFENVIQFSFGYLLLTGTSASHNILSEHKAKVHAGAGAFGSAFLPATTVHHPVSVEAVNDLFALIPGADIMKSQVLFVHDSSCLPLI